MTSIHVDMEVVEGKSGRALVGLVDAITVSYACTQCGELLNTRDWGDGLFRILANRIGRITTDGVISQTKPRDSIEPEGIASGPNGNIWFTEFHADAIGELILPKAP